MQYTHANHCVKFDCALNNHVGQKPACSALVLIFKILEPISIVVCRQQANGASRLFCVGPGKLYCNTLIHYICIVHALGACHYTGSSVLEVKHNGTLSLVLYSLLHVPVFMSMHIANHMT